MRRMMVGLGVLLALGLLLAACGGGGATGEAPGIVIEMGDMYYKPNTLTAKPGQTLQITLDNRGSLEHNFVLYDDPSERIPVRPRVAFQGEPGAYSHEA
ncbi:MAG: hypothetical protein RMM10_05665, partial [Anaerolineae bacterium]|uniref:cupredoxin domain-containing protein n=1 Tax=Thermoflexus sp. TaxID=1969742 RepID=UPI0025ECA676